MGTDQVGRVRQVSVLFAATGLLLVIAGSFLPWVISGNVRRSSYAIVGVVDRLGLGRDGVIGVIAGAWPFLGLLTMIPVVFACLRRWRFAGALAVVAAVPAVVLSVGALAFSVGRVGLTIRLDPIGPAVMASGAILMAAGGAALVAGWGSPDRWMASSGTGSPHDGRS